jgi:DNA-binding NtrC family response regulator
MPDHAGKILVVDDDPDIVANLSDILCDLGYHPSSAHNGTTALGLVEQQKFDVAIVDYKMPGMDGSTLLSKIRQRQPETTAIMVTGFAEDQRINSAVADGDLQVFRKPVDIKALLKLIESSIESKNN